MTKVRTSNIVAIVVTVALLLAMLPTVVLAAEEGSINGEFTLGDAAPTVDNVTLYDAAGTTPVTTPMTPETEYVIKVTVTDTNSLNDLEFVKVTLYWDEDGSYSELAVPTTGDAQTCAIMTAYNSPNWTSDNWTLAAGGSARWSAVLFTPPANTDLSSGTFAFKFKVGKVATMTEGAARWLIHAEANDTTESDTNYQANREMAWYGELTISGEVSWSGLTPGEGFTPGTDNISETYITNGTYEITVAADEAWNSATLVTDNSTLTASKFAIKAHSTTTEGSAQIVQSYDDTLWSAAIQTGGQTTESGVSATNNTLWLSLGSPFPNGTYSGSIYYKISN